MRIFDPSIAVLVVEDEVLIRIDVAATIEGAGFRVFEAGDADQAIRILHDHADIRVLFTDVEMPGSMDGLALAHHARARSQTIKIIVTSGRRTIEAERLPVEAIFFAKPYQPNHVVERLKALTL